MVKEPALAIVAFILITSIHYTKRGVGGKGLFSEVRIYAM